MVNKENVRKWVDALRSGKYKQCRSYLNKGDAYCCLGVACEVAFKNGVAVEIVNLNENTSNAEAIRSYNKNTIDLPTVVKEWLGFEQHSPTVRLSNNREEFLTNLNDSYKFSFEQIADLIEAQFINGEQV